MLAALVGCGLACRVASALACPTSASLDGDAATVARLRVALAARGIASVRRPGCDQRGIQVRVRARSGAAGFDLWLIDHEGRADQRHLLRPETAAILIESRLRPELDEDLAAREVGRAPGAARRAFSPSAEDASPAPNGSGAVSATLPRPAAQPVRRAPEAGQLELATVVAAPDEPVGTAFRAALRSAPDGVEARTAEAVVAAAPDGVEARTAEAMVAAAPDGVEARAAEAVVAARAPRSAPEAASRLFLALAGESTREGRGAWSAGASAGACLRLGRSCAGVTGRLREAVGQPPEGVEAWSRRLDLLLTAELPLRLGPFVVSPALALGMGRMSGGLLGGPTERGDPLPGEREGRRDGDGDRDRDGDGDGDRRRSSGERDGQRMNGEGGGPQNRAGADERREVRSTSGARHVLCGAAGIGLALPVGGGLALGLDLATGLDLWRPQAGPAPARQAQVRAGIGLRYGRF